MDRRGPFRSIYVIYKVMINVSVMKGAWHMKLRTKRGDLIVTAEEEDGTILKLAPAFDPYINKKQNSKASDRPQAFLKYLEKLEQVFKEANRPLKSI